MHDAHVQPFAFPSPKPNAAERSRTVAKLASYVSLARSLVSLSLSVKEEGRAMATLCRRELTLHTGATTHTVSYINALRHPRDCSTTLGYVRVYNGRSRVHLRCCINYAHAFISSSAMSDW